MTQPKVCLTTNGTPYLKEPGVALLAAPAVDLGGMEPFLSEFDPDLSFDEYLNDDGYMSSGSELCKAAGQLCYMSFGPGRTKNAEARKYFDNIKSSGHGSVLEHANFSLLFWGISRSCTHELVRHRAGFAYSQVSQRYVSGKTLRFVERPEYQHDEVMHTRFTARIDSARAEYDLLAEHLMTKSALVLDSMTKTERRKAVNQTARSCLPNETEAPIVVTGNARAWRHLLEMRGSPHAEPEIRRLAVQSLFVLQDAETEIFSDFTVLKDGALEHLESKWRKV